MYRPKNQFLQFAVLQWDEHDSISLVIADELIASGYDTEVINPCTTISKDVDVLITTGPYGNLYQFLANNFNQKKKLRPVVVHWNTEGIPDPKLPWRYIQFIGRIRAWFGRLEGNWEANKQLYKMINIFNKGMYRFYYVGLYDYIYRKGWLNILADSSAIYAGIRTKNGMPTIHVPWGATPRWYANLQLDRDIDVLWMGNRATRRRSLILDNVRSTLDKHKVSMHIADNIENPFIFADQRTKLLNRSKITLNITRTWFDDNFSRFSLAASNRSLLVSEHLLDHCPLVKPGIHYGASPSKDLAEAIIHYLEDVSAREILVENAFHLVTTKLAFKHSVAKMAYAAESYLSAGTKAAGSVR